MVSGLADAKAGDSVAEAVAEAVVVAVVEAVAVSGSHPPGKSAGPTQDEVPGHPALQGEGQQW